MPAKFCAFGTETKRILKNFKKILRFFSSKSIWNIDFFHNFLLNISLISDPLRKYILVPLEDNSRFLQQFFLRLGEGGRSGVPPHDSTVRLFAFFSKDLSMSIIVCFDSV